jgi:hypothetical protein
MGDYVTLTCPTCGASLCAGRDAVGRGAVAPRRLVCASCGNEHLLRPDGGIVARSRDAAQDAAPDPAESARLERLRGESAELEEQIHTLALAIVQREYRQAAAALVPLGRLTLRELKALLKTRETLAPAALIAALTVGELAPYIEQYQGSPLIMSRKRREGVEDVGRLLTLRLQSSVRQAQRRVPER